MRAAIGLAVVASAVAMSLFANDIANLPALVDGAKASIRGMGPWAPFGLVLVHSLAILVCFPLTVGFEVFAGALFGWKV